MKPKVTLELHDKEVIEAIKQTAVAFLHEAGGELASQVKRNTAVDTGQLKGSWQYKVDDSKLEAHIGSPLENAIWEEYGTGEYALNGDGRKGGWYVPAENLSTKAKRRMRKTKINGKEFYFTRGKKPKRAFTLAYAKMKPKIIKQAQKRFKRITK